MNMTQSTARELWNYNPDTGVLTWRKSNANHIKARREAGCLRKKWGGKTYREVSLKGYGRFYAHRIIWLWMTGHRPEGTEEIDHKDGDGSNNRWDNLRLVSGRSEQGRNMRLSAKNTSGAVGVSFHKGTSKYQANIRVNRRLHYLGIFARLDDAISAREAASKAHGFHPNHGQARPL